MSDVSEGRAGLVGRAGERRLVAGLLDDVLAGRGRTCLILGEAGIGKTLVVDRDGELDFAHDLVRETLYAGLSVRRRAELHRGAAEAMPYGAPAELSAH
jgi:predicted ATPase